MKRLAVLSLVLTLVGLTGNLTAQEPRPASSASPLERLTKRVQEYYSLLQAQDWTKAEAYLTDDSKEIFRNTPKSANLGFRIRSTRIKDSGQQATAEVMVKFVVAPLPAPVEAAQVTIWKLVNGDWYCQLEKPGAGPTAYAPFQSDKARDYPTHPEYLKFVGKTYGFGEFEQGTRKVARFPFTNVSDKTVRITEVDTRCDCLRAEGFKDEYKPGESGEIVINFDSSRYLRQYDQTVIVTADPDNQVYNLRVHGFIREKGWKEMVEKSRQDSKKEPKP